MDGWGRILKESIRGYAPWIPHDHRPPTSVLQVKLAAVVRVFRGAWGFLEVEDGFTGAGEVEPVAGLDLEIAWFISDPLGAQAQPGFVGSESVFLVLQRGDLGV